MSEDFISEDNVQYVLEVNQNSGIEEGDDVILDYEEDDEEDDRGSEIFLFLFLFDRPHRPSASSSRSSSSSLGRSIDLPRLLHGLLSHLRSALEERGRPRSVDPQSPLGLSASVDQPKKRR